ncbi:hypothetical protein BBJ28_00013429 [Nothophytophthora sp. Chile5]|nr:hypothetical protein BBJ28_00013429 [Nothophytophthora sp. Chile5]
MNKQQPTMEEDDPIVREIPVHLADGLRNNLCVPALCLCKHTFSTALLLSKWSTNRVALMDGWMASSYMVQFPLRPTYRPMPTPPRRARIKPNNQMLQLDFAVDQRSEHYDRDAEEYLQQKHLLLQSSNVPALTNYAVGVFRQGQLHLTPVSAVMQMRPSLAHIDDAVDEDEEDMEMEEKVEAPPSEVKEVQFQFKKKQSERAISAIQNSYAYRKQQVDAELWMDLQVQDKSEFESLFSEREEEVTSAMSTEEYLKALRYRTMLSAENSAASANPAQYVSVTNIEEEEKDELMEPAAATGPLLADVDAKYADVLRLLATDHIMHFDTLSKLLPTRSEPELLDALSHVAVHFAVLDSTSRTWSFRLGPDESFAKRFPAVARAIKL